MTDTAPALREMELLRKKLERLNDDHQRAMQSGTFEQAARLQDKIAELMDKKDAIRRYLGW